MDERWNQTLQSILVKFVGDKRDSWAAYLDTSVYAYNTSVHDSTKYTPFELMFGRTATLPIDINMDSESAEDVAEIAQGKTFDEALHKQKETKRKEVLQTAKDNILRAQERQKHYYDRKRATPEVFLPGQLVLRKDFRRKKQKGGKLGPRYRVL